MPRFLQVLYRPEGSFIPEGISVTPGPTRDRVYLRCKDIIGVITLPKAGWDFNKRPYAMHYTVSEKPKGKS